MDAKFLLLTGAVSTLGFGSAWVVTAPASGPAPAPFANPAPATSSAKPRPAERADSAQTEADAFLKADARAHAAAMAYSESGRRDAPERRFGSPSGAGSSVYYSGCNAVRAAGAAPLYAGQPGYRPEMDGDLDGIACEPHRH